MRSSCVHATVSLALAMCASTAGAATFDVSGFGTAGFTLTDTDKAQFVRDSQPVGADSRGDIGVDSRAAVQATAHLNDVFSGTVQLMLRRRFERDFALDVPMAFVKAKVANELSARVGRLPLPAFMVSDFRQVGYANTWLRPPVEVYSQVPIDSVDGLDVLYSKSFDDVTVDSQAFYGSSHIDASSTDVHSSAKDFWGANVSATMGPLTLRAGRVEMKLTLDLPFASEITGAVRSAGFTALADQIASDDKFYGLTGFGANLDWHNLIVQAEHTRVTSDSWLADTKGQYALVGYRVGKFTPYAIYSKVTVTSVRTSDVIPHTGPLAPVAFAVDALIGGNEQNTTSAGLRWDAASSLAVKFQYDHVDPEGMGLFADVQPGFRGPVNVFGIAVDVVF